MLLCGVGLWVVNILGSVVNAHVLSRCDNRHGGVGSYYSRWMMCVPCFHVGHTHYRGNTPRPSRIVVPVNLKNMLVCVSVLVSVLVEQVNTL